jgi:hypothetical protein
MVNTGLPGVKPCSEGGHGPTHEYQSANRRRALPSVRAFNLITTRGLTVSFISTGAYLQQEQALTVFVYAGTLYEYAFLKQRLMELMGRLVQPDVD